MVLVGSWWLIVVGGVGVGVGGSWWFLVVIGGS